jgi:Domain of unknown function (DUF4082)/Bacterial Ig-like domain/Bacterial Ig domain
VRVLHAERAAAAACDPPANEIVCENSKPGNPPGEWDVEGAGDPGIQGFATDISVDRGQTVRFKVDTAATAYHLEIYRMGYYGGDGARRVATVQPSAALPQNQPPCEKETDDQTGLLDCGDWHQSASWPVPAGAVSGIYFAKLVRDDKPSSEGSHILFVVRNDGGDSDLLFQTSDTTWQAYNRYGGNSLYEGGPGTDPDRAFKVSYNRPLTTRGTTPEDAPFSAEYPMVRWLERNGYDVSYFSGVDTDRRGAEILRHKAFLSVGHDEYWSAQQRANVEAAREAGVDLAFFSGNEVFWKTRWEDSIDGSGADHRTLVCYKETHANAKIDPEANLWTGTWRDPRFSPPADGGQPENSLSGTIFTVDAGTGPIEVPAAFGKMRLWRDTSVASLAPGQTATLAAGTLGYEWDEDLDNGARPAGLADLSATTMEVPQKLLDYGSNYAPGTATHHLTLYRAPSGALVFGAGTVQWSWGLDGEHDRGGSSADPRMQQATTNLFADMGVRPTTLQNDLVPATQTADHDPPTTTIVAPGDGADLESGKPTTISGSADDLTGETAGGQVAAVEVSTDGGSRWHPAQGRDHWSYQWTPGSAGSTTVLARAVDDSANLEQSGDQVTVEVVPHTCPCSIWDESFTAPQDSDAGAVEVGVKFRSDSPGFITGLRFYKTAGNTGTHIGHLWTAGGVELAAATFSGESSSGWQEVSFDGPVAVAAGSTYVASYYAPDGHYASIGGYFSLVGVDSSPLHALADGVQGGNGIFKYGHSGSLFSGAGPETFGAANYLVDVVFENEAGVDTTAPQVTVLGPAPGAGEVSAGVTVGATFSEAMAAASLSSSSVELRDGSGAPVPATISYNAAERRLSLAPAGELAPSTLYSATIKGGAGGAADLAGNPLAHDTIWSFTTAPPPPPPPDQGPGGPILVISNAANPFSRYYAEILRAEGLNDFGSTDVSALSPAILNSHDVAILGEGSLSAAQAQMLDNWVEQGGNLIAMRPDQRLAGLLGLSDAGGTLANAYLKVDAGTEAGAGIVDQTIQFHGPADRYAASGAATIATLYSDAATATSSPAVTLRSVGSDGGQAAAFSYDLAKSVVYTRQGNPAWSGEDRDGEPPIRSDDLFFGAKQGDVQPDWVDLNKVAIPQADEQQRLLTNLIERMSVDRKPIPRFWFLPRDEKAAVVMTGDDHGVGGTAGRFDRYEDKSPPGCVVANWECVRSTSYVFPNTPISDGEVAAYTAAGFEIGLHTLTDCQNWTDQAQLESFYSSQLQTLGANFPSVPAPTTNRTHCIVWSDWATQPKVERQNGIRLDTTYYYWPGSWVKDRPGMFTGSGMPMRFADLDGSMIDVYQAATQMTDESEQSYPFTVDTLLDNALGPDGYYGVFTANMHTDGVESADSDAVIASAQARGVPVVSAKQMLRWLDGRNQSSFGNIGWAGHRLGFTINPGSGANGLRAMLPTTSSAGNLVSVERAGAPVATTARTVKGIEYAFFDAAAGSYTAVYEVPELSATAPASPAHSSSPTITGSAPSGTTVRVYTGSDCGGAAIATTTAAQLAAGIGVSVPSNATTTFRATATSAAGHTSPCSPPLTYVEDSIAPDTRIDAEPGDLTSSTSAQFSFAGDDGAGSGIAGFECRLDAGAFAACASPRAYGSLPDGSHSFEVRAIDRAGNADPAAASFVWSVDSTAPDVSIDSLSTGLVGVGGTTEVHWRADENGSFALRVGASDCASGTVVDSGAYSAQPAAHTSAVTALQLAEGVNSLRLCLEDAASNSGSASIAVTKDTIAPETSIAANPADPSAHPAADFAFNGDPGAGSGIASFECSLDEGAFAACASPRNYASLSEGPHRFEVRAIDAAGNPDPTPAAFDWSVDTAAPDVAIDSGPSGPSNDPTPTFTFAGDPGSDFECSIDTGTPSFGPCSAAGSHTPQSPLADGPYTFRVRATDAAHNQATAARAFTVDTVIPPAPDLEATLPASPANDNAPQVTGSAEAGTTIELYAGADCSGVSIASGSAGELAAGITVSAPDDETTEFRATATSVAGNVSPCSAPIAYTEDSTAPETQIDSGPSGTIDVDSATFAFSSEPGASFECSLDGGPFVGCTSPRTMNALADGPHLFEVRATDLAGNTDASSAARAFSVSTIPIVPVVTIDSLSRELLGAGDSTELRWHANEDGSFHLRVGGADCGDGTVVDSGAYSTPGIRVSTVTAAQLAEGANTLRLCFFDSAGNSDEATVPVHKDSGPPDTRISAKPADPSNGAVEFGFSGDDGAGSGVAGFQCDLDGAGFTPCVSPLRYGALADGPHKFEVRAIDNAANADPSPAAYAWTVNAASAPATNPPPAPGAGAVRLLRYRYSERKNAAILVVQVPGPGWLSARTPEEAPHADLRKLGATSAAQRLRKVPQIRFNSVLASQAGAVKLAVKLTPVAQKLLAENSRLKLRVELSFEPTAGSSLSRTVTVVLKKRDGR